MLTFVVIGILSAIAGRSAPPGQRRRDEPRQQNELDVIAAPSSADIVRRRDRKDHRCGARAVVSSPASGMVLLPFRLADPGHRWSAPCSSSPSASTPSSAEGPPDDRAGHHRPRSGQAPLVEMRNISVRFRRRPRGPREPTSRARVVQPRAEETGPARRSRLSAQGRASVDLSTQRTSMLREVDLRDALIDVQNDSPSAGQSEGRAGPHVLGASCTRARAGCTRGPRGRPKATRCCASRPAGPGLGAPGWVTCAGHRRPLGEMMSRGRRRRRARCRPRCPGSARSKRSRTMPERRDCITTAPSTAPVSSDPAGERCPADDGGGDHVELVLLPEARHPALSGGGPIAPAIADRMRSPRRST